MDAKAVAGQAKAADGQGKAAADQGKAVPHDPLRRAELKERRLPGRLSHFEYEQPYRPTVDTAPSGGATIGRRRRLRQQLGDGGGKRLERVCGEDVQPWPVQDLRKQKHVERPAERPGVLAPPVRLRVQPPPPPLQTARQLGSPAAGGCCWERGQRVPVAVELQVRDMPAAAEEPRCKAVIWQRKGVEDSASHRQVGQRDRTRPQQPGGNPAQAGPLGVRKERQCLSYEDGGKTRQRQCRAAAKAAHAQGKGSVFAAKAAQAHGKGSVLAAKAAHAQGTGSVLAAEAAQTQGNGSVAPPRCRAPAAQRRRPTAGQPKYGKATRRSPTPARRSGHPRRGW